MSNFFSCIERAASRFADRPAIELVRAAGLETTTYGALMTEARRVSGWLAHAGVASGDRVAILADNDARWIARYLGILHRGAVAVPLDTAYKPGQVRIVMENSGARLLFTSPRYLDVARAAGPSGAWSLALLAGHGEGVPDADDVAAREPAAAMADAGDGDAAVMLYTSGTTSDPKGVVLTHANLVAEQAAAFQVVGVSERDAILGVLPLFHALAQMANLLLPLSVGARVVFLESVSSTTLIEALSSRRITIFACVPQFFYLIHKRVTDEVSRKGPLARRLVAGMLRLCGLVRDHTPFNPGKRVFARVHQAAGPAMRIFVTGGSRFDPAIGRDLYGMGFTLLNAYGLTETSGGATIVRPGDRFTTSVGQPLPGVEVKIEGVGSPPVENSPGVTPLRPGEFSTGGDPTPSGEILIRGPIVMREYFNRPDATREALRDGWLHTGDLGRIDGEGRLYITGRLKEIIVLASGKNLYPEEIEAHYRQAPVVKELCVLGLTKPDEPAAERLHAVIVPDEDVLRERSVVNVRELVRFEIEGLSVQLPPHKRILSYDISLEPLPRTTTGKIRRHEVERRLRERAAAEGPTERALSDDDRAWLSDPPRAELVSVIAARLDRPALNPSDNLELDLSLDSMERVELLTTLERRLGTAVTPDVRATIFTVRQLVDAVRAAPADRGRAAPDEADLAWESVLREAPEPALLQNLERRKWLRAAVLFVLLRLAVLPLRVLTRFETRGQAHVPRAGACIISPNHQTYLDAFLLAARLPFGVFRRVFLVGAAEYFETRLMRWLAHAINVVPVDPNANLVSAMRAGAAGLRLGKVLILFPEGERSIDGELKTFRKGAAILASHLDVAIVPVAFDGLFPLWPRGLPPNWRMLRPGATQVRLEFGEPLRVARGAYDEGTAALRAAVERMFTSMRRRPA